MNTCTTEFAVCTFGSAPHYSLQDVCTASELLHSGLPTTLDAIGTISGAKGIVKGVQLGAGLLSGGIAIATSPSDVPLAGAGLGLTFAEKTSHLHDYTAVAIPHPPGGSVVRGGGVAGRVMALAAGVWLQHQEGDDEQHDYAQHHEDKDAAAALGAVFIGRRGFMHGGWMLPDLPVEMPRR